MKTDPLRPDSVTKYIAGFPREFQKELKMIRATIRKAAPEAVESISYQIPAYKLNGKILIYFAGFTKHISVYPAPRQTKEFKKELSAYKGGKGTVQFPLDRPIPYDLITRIVRFRSDLILANKEKPAPK